MAYKTWAGLCVSCCVATAHSQTIPPPASSAEQEQRRAQERERNQREQLERTPDVRLAPAPVTTGRLPTEPNCFVINQLLLKTAQNEKPQVAPQFGWLLGALAGPEHNDSPTGRCLGSEGISLTLKRAQDALVARGFVTSRIVAEPQNLSQGTFTLTLIPGRINAIRFSSTGSGYASKATANAALPASIGDIINLRDIEQTLENLKRVPSANADIQIEATPSAPSVNSDTTSAPGQSDLVISHQQGRPIRVSVSLDDGGTQATSRYQGGLTLSYDNPFAINDLLYISLNRGVLGQALGGSPPGERGTSGTTVHYSFPVGYWLWGATASNNAYRQAVAGANQTYLYRGTSSNAEVKLSRLIYRDALRKTTLSIRAFRRTSSNFVDDTEVLVQKRIVGGFEAAANHREFIPLSVGQATLDLDLAYKRGTGAFGSLRAPEEAFGEGTSRMKVTTAAVSFNAPLKALGGYTANLSYNGSLRLQYNTTPLTPQDRFAIGGRYSVRGFDGEAALIGERGWFVRNEISAALGQSGDAWYVGMDYGQVGGPSTAILAEKSLTGAVIGVRGAFKGVQYDLFLGAPVKKPELFKTAKVTGGFLLNYSF